MNRFSFSGWLRFSLFLSFMVIGTIVWAQPGDPGDDPDIPVDGGVTLLLAAGAGYGIKRYRDSRQKNTNG